MVKSDRENGKSYYAQVKEENERLKEKVSWLDSESFLLDSSADIRQVYSFMKRNPSSAKFIFKKYKALQPTIRELCDPDNPLYLDGVKKSLEGIVQNEEAKEDLKSIQEKIGFLGRERDKPKKN